MINQQEIEFLFLGLLFGAVGLPLLIAMIWYGAIYRQNRQDRIHNKLEKSNIISQLESELEDARKVWQYHNSHITGNQIAYEEASKNLRIAEKNLAKAKRL